ncbi:MAG TPA: DUF3318 domain-containing protein [Crinalium sp.]|jgi:hypothetical protein
MQLPRSGSPEINEIRRLEALLPEELESQINIVPCAQRSHFPIANQRIEGQFSIQIDWTQWRSLTISQRDMLFCHEVARIQGRAIARSSWEVIAIGIGLSAALVELPSHSVIAFSVALAASGLAAYRLYQRKWGEQSLRDATAADQAAIELAMQLGYSFADAHDSLYEVLNRLAKQPAYKKRWKQYQVRLRVLEMLASSKNKGPQPLVLNLNATRDREVIRRSSRNLAF